MAAAATQTGPGDGPEKALNTGHYLDGGGTETGPADAAAGSALAQVYPMLVRKDLTPTSSRLILIMVGLPARGKSFISIKMHTFLAWMGYDVRIFNVGEQRRQKETDVQDAAYFDPHNEVAALKREKLAFDALSGLLDWLDSRPKDMSAVAIFDATNSTAERRRKIQDFIALRGDEYAPVFVESYCNDPDVLEANIRMKLSKSPDYRTMDQAEARKDLLERVTNYEKKYEPVGDNSEDYLSYIKLINLSSHLVAHRVYGRMTSQLLPYLMAIHISNRPVWLIRMPQSAEEGKSGLCFGDNDMTQEGRVFACKLAKYAEKSGLRRAFACSYRRALEMSQIIDESQRSIEVRTALNSMDWGSYNGITRKELPEKASKEWYESFTSDPVSTRFPAGESYADLIRRVMPVLIEVEQQLEPVAVIAPLNVLQVLACYFFNMPVKEAMHVELPQHAIVELRPDGAKYTHRVIPEGEFGD